MAVYRMGKPELIPKQLAEQPELLEDLRRTLEAAAWLEPIAREAVKRGTCAPEVADWLRRVEERFADELDRVTN